MARFKITLFKSNIRKDGSCPVCLRVAKEDKTKYIDLQLSATKGQWDEQASRFKKDKRVNPNYENYNALLNRYEVRKDEILQKFMVKAGQGLRLLYATGGKLKSHTAYR